MGVNSLPKTVTRQRRGCDLNPDPSAPESSTLTTPLPSHIQVCVPLLREAASLSSSSPLDTESGSSDAAAVDERGMKSAATMRHAIADEFISPCDKRSRQVVSR